MIYNEIGKTGMRVSNLGFGASSLGGVFRGIKEDEAIKAVFTAVENGINFIDVSPYYGHLKAETVLGKALKDYPEDAKTEDRLIKGCQSRVWLDHSVEDGKIIFNADSDAIITKGIISLLTGIYSGRTPQEILSSDFSVVEKIGLKENLSPTRANGLVSMIAKIREVAKDNM